jgi:hypothetical protein
MQNWQVKEIVATGETIVTVGDFVIEMKNGRETKRGQAVKDNFDREKFARELIAGKRPGLENVKP